MIVTLNQEYIKRLCIQEALKLPQIEQNLMRSNPQVLGDPAALEAKLFVEKEEIKAVIISRHD